MRTALAVVLVAGLLALGAACGGDGGDDAGAPPEDTQATQTDTGGETGEETGGEEASGADVFASAGCGGCHTLEAAGSAGTTGPNLDDLAPSVEQVEEQVRNGGGGMPAFGDRLSDAEITAVAEFVADGS